MAHEKQVLYAKLAEKKLRAALVTKDGVIFNNIYQGDASTGSVKIPIRNNIDARTYNPATGLPANTSDTTYLSILVDEQTAIHELIDDYDAQSVPDDLVAYAVDAGAQGIAENLDKRGIETLVTEGTATGTTTALTKTTIYDAIVSAREALNVANVPASERYLIVAPAVYSLLLKDTTNFIRQSDLSQKLLESGAIGQILGFTVYESNHLPADVEFIVGHKVCATRVTAFRKQIYVEDAGGDYIAATAVKGRVAYKHKVTKPEGILVKKKTVTP